jgi:hypothetical protein
MQRQASKKIREPVVAAVNCHVRFVSYAREIGTSTEVPYAKKFEQLIRICDKARRSRTDTVLVAGPEVLGDTYVEVLESLQRIARAGLVLAVLSDEKSP